MGMGIDLRGVNNITHYGAPSSMEDYFQGSGRGDRSGVLETSRLPPTPEKETLNFYTAMRSMISGDTWRIL